MPATSDQQICLNCGICCGGTLFDYGKVEAEEEDQLRELGFHVGMEHGRPGFPIPCGHLSGMTCQIYAQRPITCRKFTCTTLSAIRSGEIEEVEASRRIEAAKTALEVVRRHLQPNETFFAFRQRFANVEPIPADLRLAMVAYEMLLDRYFRKPHQQTFGD